MPADLHTTSELHGIVKFLLGPAMVYLSELADDLESQGDDTGLAEKIRGHASVITREFSSLGETADLCAQYGRRPATVAEARKLLNLAPA